MKGLSQENMAEEMKITQSSYARFENGAKKIDFRLVELACTFFEMPVESVIKFHQSRDTLLGSSQETQVSEPAYTYPSKEAFMQTLQERNRYLESRFAILEEYNRTLKEQMADKVEIIVMLREKVQTLKKSK